MKIARKKENHSCEQVFLVLMQILAGTLLFLVLTPGAQADSPLDELRREFGNLSPGRAKVMADDCERLVNSMSQGWNSLLQQARPLAETNKNYHKYQDLANTASRTLANAEKALDDAEESFSYLMKTCEEAYELYTGYVERFQWWKPEGQSWKGKIINYWRDYYRNQERQQMMKQIPECVRANKFYDETIRNKVDEAVEAAKSQRAMSIEFKRGKEAYMEAFARYTNAFYNHVKDPYVKYVKKCGHDSDTEWGKLGLQFPQFEDYMSEKTLASFLRNIEDARAETRNRCNRLRTWARLKKEDEDMAVSWARNLIRACKFDEAENVIQGRISDGTIKASLKKDLDTAKRREENVSSKYEEGRAKYQQAQREEKAGNLAQARTDYERAIADLNAARGMTRCENRVKNIDKGLSKVKNGLAQVNRMLSAQARGGTAKPPPSPVDGTKDWRDRWAGTWKGKGQQKLKGPREGQTIDCTVTLKIQPGGCKGGICTLSVQMQASALSFPADNSYTVDVDVAKPTRGAKSWTRQGGRLDKDGKSLLASHSVDFLSGDNRLRGVYSFSEDISSYRSAGASLEFTADRISR